MSDEPMNDDQFDEQAELHVDGVVAHAEIDDEYEEISSDEVDRMVESLERLIDSSESENIKAILEDASNNIYYLVYTDEDAEDEDDDEVLMEEAA